MAHHPLAPAAGGTHDGEETHPAGRGHVVEGVAAGDGQPGHGGGGEEPAGEGQQPHAGHQGDEGQQQTQREAEPVLAVEAQERQ
ncbi:hypothetical protein D3C85_966760 [compost metagenome]